MPNVIAYDLDGVLLADANVELFPIKDFLRIRSAFPKALFVPKGDYYIITGRPKEDLEYTLAWIENELKSNPPKQVFHDNTDYRLGAQYKIEVLSNLKEVTMFVESSYEQTVLIRKALQNLLVVHFAEMINGMFDILPEIAKGAD